MGLIQVLLFPFSLIYDLITRIRNFFFDNGVFKSVRFTVPIISVGNIRVGGTGKTPHIEFLIEAFKNNYTIAVLSRGYGRKTKGVLMADKNATADTIGDEPFQIYKKYANEVSVCVGESRVEAVPQILHENDDTNLILLDDAYQHRYIDRDINILLTEYAQPFYKDYVLPAGRLRESRSAAQRSDVVVVTKCPASIQAEKETIEKNIQLYTASPVFFSKIVYAEMKFHKMPENDFNKVILFTGIANDAPLKAFLTEKYDVIEVRKFQDHHNFSEKDVEELYHLYQKHKALKPILVTTEKDYSRLGLSLNNSVLKDVPLGFVPIKVEVENEQELLSLIKEKIKN